MSRKRKRRAQSKYRWGFVLDVENERDAAIHEWLNELALDDRASEYIRQAIYTRMQMDSTAPDVERDVTLLDIAAQIDALSRQMDRMQVVERPASVPELDDERASRLESKLLNMQFSKRT